MKYKTLFRLLLKLLGVWFVVDGLSRSITHVAYAIEMTNLNTTMSVIAYWGLLIRSITGLFEIAVGCYFFRGGEWIVNRVIPSNRPYCAECGYDLTGNTTGTCPECGLRLVGGSGPKTHESQAPSDLP